MQQKKVTENDNRHRHLTTLLTDWLYNTVPSPQRRLTELDSNTSSSIQKARNPSRDDDRELMARDANYCRIFVLVYDEMGCNTKVHTYHYDEDDGSVKPCRMIPIGTPAKHGDGLNLTTLRLNADTIEMKSTWISYINNSVQHRSEIKS
ncbi:hypothetical protein MAR_031821 [Mya arenaria]|uniref:Uncharacterized protein n=1 Tax=Mya arenaria TaxID=6604 RepID=A0ABY7F4X7_MYAAR|nr:hypothetical protein MAR_031821 [Mya arenaria]